MATFLPPWIWPHSCHPEDGHIRAALKMSTFLPSWRQPNASRPEDGHILATLKTAKCLPPWRWSHSCSHEDGHILAIPQDGHILAALKMATFLTPWRWPHEWPKHVGGYYIINLHSYTQVHSWMVPSCCIFLNKVLSDQTQPWRSSILCNDALDLTQSAFVGLFQKLWTSNLYYAGDFSIPAEVTDLSFLQNIQTLGPNQPPVQCVPVMFLGVKRQEGEVNHSPPSSAEVKNEWSFTHTPPVCLHDVNREKLYFYFRRPFEYRPRHLSQNFLIRPALNVRSSNSSHPYRRTHL
jgi:hypothetical protein